MYAVTACNTAAAPFRHLELLCRAGENGKLTSSAGWTLHQFSYIRARHASMRSRQATGRPLPRAGPSAFPPCSVQARRPMSTAMVGGHASDLVRARGSRSVTAAAGGDAAPAAQPAAAPAGQQQAPPPPQQQPALRTCRRCKQQFDPEENGPGSCRYHSALWTGGEVAKASAAAAGCAGL